MKKSSKALVLSGLVFPGLGQIILKRYKAAAVIMLAVAISFYKMLSIALEQANAIVNKVITQGGVLDMQAITDAATQATISTDNSTFKLYLWVIIVCWLISIVDAWVTGKKSTETSV